MRKKTEKERKKWTGKFNRNVISSTCDFSFCFAFLLNCKIDWKEMCVCSKEKVRKSQCHSTTINWFFFFRRHLQRNGMNIQYYLLNVFISRCSWSSANCQWSECSIYWLHPKERRRKIDVEQKKIAPMHRHTHKWHQQKQNSRVINEYSSDSVWWWKCRVDVSLRWITYEPFN